MTEHNLTLRPAIIGGEREEGDYSVFWMDGDKERLIGRIKSDMHHVEKTKGWNWTITVPLTVPSWSYGRSPSRDEATTAFRKAWERFYAELTPKEIALWHKTVDARQ